MTAAAAVPPPPAPPAPANLFLGRSEEGRAVILSARTGRSIVLVGPMGYGKSALLAELAPALEHVALTLQVPVAAPFGTFLGDPAAALLLGGVQLPGADLPGWKKAHAVNDAKARSLVLVLRDYRTTGATPPVILVDDATGLTQSMVPALLALAEYAAVVCACQPETVRQAGLSRWWNKCDRVDLGPLDRAQARELVDDLTARFGIVAENIGAYKNRVLSLEEGIPGKLERLVRYVSTHDLVSNVDIGSTFAQQAAQR